MRRGKERLRPQDGPSTTGTMRGTFLAAAAAAAIALGTPLARAQQSTPNITNSNYSLDIFQGPITNSSRVIGLAGAFAAVAEGCEGEYANAASPAVRTPYSLGKWDYDICLGFTNPGIFKGSDFENRGSGYEQLPTRFTNSFTFNAGIQVQFSTVGITADFDELRLGLVAHNANDTLVINRVVASIANSFLDDQLVLGVGFRAVTFGLNQQLNGALSALLSSAGANTQFGMILKPRLVPFRIGVTVRPEIHVSGLQGNAATAAIAPTTGGYYLPSSVVMPWEVEAGAVVELGKRPLNPTRIDATFVEEQLRARFEASRAERAIDYDRRLETLTGDARERMRRSLELRELALEEREEEEINRDLGAIVAGQKVRARLWDRHQMQIYAAVLVTGATANGIGITDVITQKAVASGQSAVVSPRIAFETEPVPTWVRVRGGSYLEPPRYAGTEAREHFTLGLDIRLLRFNPFGLFGDDPWQIRFAGDVAPRYVNWAIGLGKYH
jgi:hypothetical protein